MQFQSVVTLFKEAFRAFSEDNASRLGAALAYYTIFSLAPLLLIAIAVAGWALGPEAAAGHISAELEGLLGPDAASAVETMVASAGETPGGVVAGVIGVLALIFGATNAFLQLQSALNTIWDVEAPAGGIKGMVVGRLLSLSMVVGIGFLLLVGLFVNAIIAGLAAQVEAVLAIPPLLLMLINIAVQLGIVTVLFAAIYKVLPDVSLSWRDVWVGAVLTAILFMIGQVAIGLYLGNSSIASAYGAAGSLIVLLVWVYYSAQLVLLGGELTHVYAKRFGSLAPAAQAGASMAGLPFHPVEDGRNDRSLLRTFGPVAAGFAAGLFLGRRRN